MPDLPRYPAVERESFNRDIEQVIVGMRILYNSHEEVKIAKQEARLASLLAQGYTILAVLPYIDDAIFYLYYGKTKSSYGYMTSPNDLIDPRPNLKGDSDDSK